MKKTNIILFIASILIVYIFASCAKEDVDSQLGKLQIIEFKEELGTQISFTKDGFTLSFKSTKSDNKIISKVKITNNVLEKEMFENVFSLNKELPLYKLGLFNDIEYLSNKLKKELNAEDWILIKKIYEDFLRILFKNIELDKYQSELIQSTFYHLSIFNTIVRSLTSKEECECTPIPDYYVEKSPFWCQEDYFFEVKNMLKFYDLNKERLFSYEGGEKEYYYIKSLVNKKDFVSYKELFQLHHSIDNYKNNALIKFEKAQTANNLSNESKTNREDCWSGALGTDLGCCGNYSGCCWYASLACLRHDIACLKCDKWHCGPSCKPE